MAGPQTIWGIDIGRCALKAVKLRAASDDKVELLAQDYIEHAQILSQPDANRDELISNALEKFLARNDLSKDGVVVSVPGQHTLSRFTKLPPVAPKKIPDIVRYEADQQIPFDMDEVIWDYQTFEREDLPDVEVGIFAMKRELIREHLLHYEQASIEPALVQSAPLAVYNAAYCDGMLADDTTILLDIGADNTDLIIATPESLWTRTISIAGNSFTEALVKSFRLSFSKAESLKRTASSSKYTRQVFQAMRPVFADLVQELQRSIGFYSSTHREAEITKVVGMGNALKLPGLQKYLQQNLGLTVERPEKFARIVESSVSSAPQFTDQLLSFAVPYGLALQGLELGKVATNLLPAELAKQAVWGKKKPTFAAAAACLLIAGGLIWFRQSSDMRALANSGAGADRVAVRVDSNPDLPIGERVELPNQILTDGPSGTPRARAQQILAAGRAMKSALDSLSGQGQQELDQAGELIDLQQNKTVVPRIIQLIHESVPLEKGALGEEVTNTALREALTADPAPREKRTHVSIRKLNIVWEPDVNLMTDWPFNKIDAAAEDVILEDPEAEQPGFFVRIFCETPNENGSQFLYDTFMKNLKTNGRRPEQGFFVNRVFLVDGQQVGAAEGVASGASGSRRSPGARTGSSRRGASGYRGPRGRTGAPAAAEVEPEDVEFDPLLARSLDPLTGEPIANDWRFEVVMDIILEELPGEEQED
jgi:type IV pilus assembly protein PilM